MSSGPFGRAGEPDMISEVNVVPLADVSLVLLIILLVLSPMMRQRMLHVKQAAQSSAPPLFAPLTPAPPELVLVVGLTTEGYTLGERRLTTAAELAQALTFEFSRRSDKKVFLSPAPEAAMDLVVKALETIKAAGAESVALVQTQEDAHAQIPTATTAP